MMFGFLESWIWGGRLVMVLVNPWLRYGHRGNYTAGFGVSPLLPNPL